MRSFLTAAVAAAAALAGSAQAATCSTATLATLLTNQYLSTCSSDSGYSFLTGVQPTPAQAALMCQSSACQSLLADVLALGLEECQLPIGNKINLFADLIDYVRNQCVTPTPTPTPTPEPTTEAPTPTPTSTPTVASCTAAQLRVILLSTYRAQCSTDASYSFTLPYVPTAEQVAAMCASSSCVSLFAEAQAAGLTECRTPTGGKILWLAELIDYVPSQCTTDAPTPAPTTEAPTPAPTTEAPTPEPTPAPTTEAPTPTPTSTPTVASCTAAQLRVILLSTYRAQCSTDASYSFTLPYVPTAEQVAAMCASSSCVSLFAEAQAAGLTECRTPTGGKILWLAELIDYVPSQCTTDAPTPAPTTEAPTPSPTTESPTPAPTTEAPTPSPTDSPNPTTSTPTSGPTATPTPEPTETPEPTTPPHDSC